MSTAIKELLDQVQLSSGSLVNRGPKMGWKDRIQNHVAGEILFNEPLSQHTSIRIGGPAEAFVSPKDVVDLQGLLSFASENLVPYFVLGLGSNVLVRDGGVAGIVICPGKGLNHFSVLEENDQEISIRAEAGVALPRLIEFCRQNNLTGMENLYGIPGSVGGTLRMNAGTREGEMKDHVSQISVVKPDGALVTYPKDKLAFEYRNLKLASKEIIVSADLKFPRGDPEHIASQFQFYQKRRRDTQPLEYPNMGSVFKNPPKHFAAQLIEELGLKDVRVGGARISSKHANFIINENHATAKDVLVLIGLIRDKVKQETQMSLELEVKVVGVDDSI